MAEFPTLDFSIISRYPEMYAAGQERRRSDAFRQALSSRAQSGRGTDYGAMVRLAQQHGFMPGIESFGRLQQSAAQLANTARHQRETESIARAQLALQEKAAQEKPQYQQITDEDGN